MRWWLTLLIIILLLNPTRSGGQTSALKVYESRYYIIHTDIPQDEAFEAEVRMTRMAEEYHNRTRAFSGTLQEKLPFFLFQNKADYVAAGGDPRSAGIFTGDQLMAIAGRQAGWGTWHTIQHEGFHQFAHKVIGGELPIWVNEGLAEYFGEAVFCGDSYVSGLIPQFRLSRIRVMVSKSSYRSIPDMMQMSHEEWNNRLALANYDQA